METTRQDVIDKAWNIITQSKEFSHSELHNLKNELSNIGINIGGTNNGNTKLRRCSN